MQTDPHKKPRLKNIAILGGGGRIGRQVADQLAYLGPDVHVRLLCSTEDKAKALRDMHPGGADVQVADYLDPASLVSGLEGMEGIFVVTPPGFDERTAMNNLVDAVRQVGSAVQIIRLVGYMPDLSPKKFPWDRLKGGGGHLIAKEILDDSDLPVTYINLAAVLMDNYFFNAHGIRESRTLIWPERCTPMMDIRDLGEVIARVFLDEDARYIGGFLTLNNGYDLLDTEQVAEAMSKAFLTPISCETSREAFLAEFGPLFTKRYGSADRAAFLLDTFEWEHDTCLWPLTDTAERILGRRPNNFHHWLVEHRTAFLPPK